RRPPGEHGTARGSDPGHDGRPSRSRRLPARRRGPALRPGDQGGRRHQARRRRPHRLRLCAARGQAAVSDSISQLLAERERQDHGLPTTLLVSLTGHFGLAGLVVALPMLLPHEPPIKLTESVFVVMPRGGGGTPQAPAPPAPEPVAKPKPEESAAPPPQVVLKPPPKAEPR